MSSGAPAFGKSISSESRRRILAALAGFRPKFRQIARTLTNVDLVFVEEAMERWMLEYDRAFACTPVHPTLPSLCDKALTQRHSYPYPFMYLATNRRNPKS